MKRYKNRRFLKGAMAASALVAKSDGVVTFSERSHIDQILEVVDALKIYDPHEAIDLFNRYLDEIGENPSDGKSRLRKIVREAVDAPKDAQLLAKICVAIGRADGKLPQEERDEIEALCGMLQIDTNNIGL